MAECPMCRGTGIIGAGDQPHLHLGQTKTCPNCAGTGNVDDVAVEEVASEVVEAPVAETQTPSSSSNEATDTVTEDLTTDTEVANPPQVTPEAIAEQEAHDLATGNTGVAPVDSEVVVAPVEGATLEVASEPVQ